MKRVMVIVAVVMVLTLALTAGPASANGGGYGFGFPGGYGPGGQVHIVRAGETLSGIAFQFGVSMFELARVNGIFNPNLIFTGQCLMIPARHFQPMPGGYGKPVYWGNNCGYQGGWGNNCGYQGGWGNNCGYQGGCGYWGNYCNTPYWGGNWGGNYGCSTCGDPIPYGFEQNEITLERNYSTTFTRG